MTETRSCADDTYAAVIQQIAAIESEGKTPTVIDIIKALRPAHPHVAYALRVMEARGEISIPLDFSVRRTQPAAEKTASLSDKQVERLAEDVNATATLNERLLAAEVRDLRQRCVEQATLITRGAKLLGYFADPACLCRPKDAPCPHKEIITLLSTKARIDIVNRHEEMQAVVEAAKAWRKNRIGLTVFAIVNRFERTPERAVDALATVEADSK